MESASGCGSNQRNTVTLRALSSLPETDLFCLHKACSSFHAGTFAAAFWQPVRILKSYSSLPLT